MELSHTREAPQQRLDEARVHVFRAEGLISALRGESEYGRSHHTGITLMKTSELRVLLEAAEPRATLESHVVHGPAVIFVIEGMLDVETQEHAFRAWPGDLVVLPRDEPRRITSLAQSTFLLALSPSAPAVAAS
jgi:quercetin dioxygenase-like cupin family protein